VVTRVFQVTGVSLVLLDVLLYFFVYQHTQSQLSSELQQFASLRQSIFVGEARIERLKKYREVLPQTDKKLASLVEGHAPLRRQAFSQASELVRRVAEKSGSQLVKVGFRMDEKVSGPLQRLGIAIDVGALSPLCSNLHTGLKPPAIYCCCGVSAWGKVRTILWSYG